MQLYLLKIRNEIHQTYDKRNILFQYHHKPNKYLEQSFEL